MRQRTTAMWTAILLLGACSRTPDQQPTANVEQQRANIVENETAPPIPPPATGPDAKTPLAEPKGPIDPKSAEAAGQVVQHYGALIEQKRWSEAEKLWGDARTAAQFTATLKRDSEVHLEIGELGNLEGAAGSIYMTMPVVFYGPDFRRPANIILRRVNDVPGSTEAQRRWHIERVENRS
jgi:hypothetical protein